MTTIKCMQNIKSNDSSSLKGRCALAFLSRQVPSFNIFKYIHNWRKHGHYIQEWSIMRSLMSITRPFSAHFLVQASTSLHLLLINDSITLFAYCSLSLSQHLWESPITFNKRAIKSKKSLIKKWFFAAKQELIAIDEQNKQI